MKNNKILKKENIDKLSSCRKKNRSIERSRQLRRGEQKNKCVVTVVTEKELKIVSDRRKSILARLELLF